MRTGLCVVWIVIAGCAARPEPPLPERDAPERSENDERGAGAPEADPVQVFREARQAAERGQAAAEDRLGMLYQRGEGVAQDYAQARLWYERASTRGYGEATNHLGSLYDHGLGVVEDNARAAQLYEKAAEQGSARAMLNLGVLLSQDQVGIALDRVEAYKWLHLARFNSRPSRDRQFKSRCREALARLGPELSEDEIRTARARSDAWMREQLRAPPSGEP